MVISRNKKNAFFDEFPIKKLRLPTTFSCLLALRAPKITLFSHFSTFEIYFKQLIVKISNSEICYFGKIIRILRRNFGFVSFRETKSGFNIFVGSFFETKSGFKLYFGSLGVFIFFEMYQ